MNESNSGGADIMPDWLKTDHIIDQFNKNDVGHDSMMNKNEGEIRREFLKTLYMGYKKGTSKEVPEYSNFG